MSAPDSDKRFAGSVPELYDQFLVPLIFEDYASDLARQLVGLGPASVLEVAAGTGVLTRVLAAELDDGVRLVASDLNQPMLDRAAGVGTSRPVTWRQADVTSLPFDDGTFDAVVCQFGVMFFPDRVAAYREVARVLRPGGTFLFNTWDRVEANEFADEVTKAVGTVFPDDPPLFLPRTPHGYFDETQIRSDVQVAGLEPVAIQVVDHRSRASTPDIPAVAYCQGTPLRNEIEARDPARLMEATEAAAAAVAVRFGDHDLDSLIRGLVVTAQQP